VDDDRDALLVVGDADTIGAAILDAERLLGEHPARINRIHMCQKQDLPGPGAGERGAHDLADLIRRVFHLVDIGGLDQLDLAAQVL
jgi:hypothetical protein